MTHKGTMRLETDRPILRRFPAKDLDQIFHNCWSDYEVWKWTSYAPMNCVADVIHSAGMLMEKWLSAYEQPNRYSWSIEL